MAKTSDQDNDQHTASTGKSGKAARKPSADKGSSTASHKRSATKAKPSLSKMPAQSTAQSAAKRRVQSAAKSVANDKTATTSSTGATKKAPAKSVGRTAGGARPSAGSSSGGPIIARSPADLEDGLKKLRRSKKTSLALVPTMGALHDGHLALVEFAGKSADKVAVSIFVNPTQFAPHEDLDTYPRQEAADIAKLTTAGVDLVWLPAVSDMYPPGFATTITPSGPAKGLETDHRPHFFKGVATVVFKLLNHVRPDIAVFGEKDYQQLCVIKAMARDLDLPTRIIGAPTVREADGLAMSSRNAYLDEKQRRIAPALHRTLQGVAADVRAGQDVARVKAEAAMQLLSEGFSKVDYIEVREADTLQPFQWQAGGLQPLAPSEGRTGRILAAAWLGTTRLIDNIAFQM